MGGFWYDFSWIWSISKGFLTSKSKLFHKLFNKLQICHLQLQIPPFLANYATGKRFSAYWTSFIWIHNEFNRCSKHAEVPFHSSLIYEFDFRGALSWKQIKIKSHAEESNENRAQHSLLWARSSSPSYQGCVLPK